VTFFFFFHQQLKCQKQVIRSYWEQAIFQVSEPESKNLMSHEKKLTFPYQTSDFFFLLSPAKIIYSLASLASLGKNYLKITSKKT